MKLVIICMFAAFIIVIYTPNTSLANEVTTFDSSMKDWNTKREKASDLLKEAELEFKKGDELQGCFKQRQAAEYGIDGTRSLIRAFEISDSTYDLSDIKAGLKKWEELRDFC